MPIDAEFGRATRPPAQVQQASSADDAVHDALEQPWSRILGRDSWSDGRSFLESGGDSLKLLTLVFEMERKFGIALPLAEFEYDMTPPDMARVVGAVLDKERCAPAVGDGSAAVLLKTGTREPPVFIGIGLGAHAAEVSALGKCLAGGRAVFALQPAGAAGGAAPSDIEAFAAEWAVAIGAIQPSGPYVLIGYSLGGLIMIEAARMLQTRGATIAMLALLDSYPHRRFWPLRPWLGRLGGRARYHLRTLAQMRPDAMPAYAAERVLSLLRQLAARLGHAAQPLPKHWNSGTAALRNLRRALVTAEARYQPTRYPGKIVFVKAETRRWEFPRDPLAVWQRLASDIELVTVPGDHITMTGDHAAALAAALDRSIERALAAD